MKLKDLLLEDTENFRIEEEGDWKTRVFITAYLKDDKKTWLDVMDDPIVELTVDINKDVARLNQIVAHRKGQGYAGEVIKYAEEKLKDLGIKKIEGYIVNTNVSSQSMIRKLGYTEERVEKQGSYWVKNI